MSIFFSGSSDKPGLNFIQSILPVPIDLEGQFYGDSELRLLDKLFKKMGQPLFLTSIVNACQRKEEILSQVRCVIIHIHSQKPACGLCSALLLNLSQQLNGIGKPCPCLDFLRKKAAEYFGPDKKAESQFALKFVEKFSTKEIKFLITFSSDHPDGNCAFLSGADRTTIDQFQNEGSCQPAKVDDFIPNILWCSFGTRKPSSFPMAQQLLSGYMNDARVRIENELKTRLEQAEIRRTQLESEIQRLQNQLNQEKAACEQAVKKVEAMGQDLYRKLQQKEEESVVLQKNVQDLKEQLVQKEIACDQLKGTVQDLRGQLHQKEEENAGLKENIQRLQNQESSCGVY